MKMNYESLKQEISDLLDQNPYFVLATSYQDHVTARIMSCVHKELFFYFQTDIEMLKYSQIEKNPKVALCIKNIQIEGKATLMGHPSKDENEFFCQLFKRQHPQSFDFYSHLKNERVIEVAPEKITLWKYIDNKSYRDYLLVDRKEAYRELYDPK
ncbi:MAG TPA: pyridoxamine 5'-phosphate oxidase [Spirochaetia bacterium]|nr:MAG: hypothetical protein A2Y41_13480 [Spirochaetes bacterium GWB1_36_13]HCL55521.1 pyridoxamine 5'-phosphate oxidase [Spirochaetia bacterium]